MTTPKPRYQATQILRAEWPLALSLLTMALFFLFGHAWMARLANPAVFSLLFSWLFAVILLSAFAVVRHADHLAHLLGEPLGTLMLTLAVSGIEVMMIAAVMLSGDGNPTLARDAMFAVVMIVLNGLVGTSLLLGGLRYREQTYNLQGAKAYLAVIVPLAVLDLVLPNFTRTTQGPTLSRLQAAFLIIMSIGLYAVFLAIQTRRHRDYFISPEASSTLRAPVPSHDEDRDEHDSNIHAHDDPHEHTIPYHAALLLAYMFPIVLLAEQIAHPIDHAIESLNAPPALGGLIVSILVLAPEAMSAIRYARSNRLQRSVNILLGSVLASISLTVPAVLLVGFLTNRYTILGLEPVEMVLLLLTLGSSALTFGAARTNVLQGAVHLLLFLAYFMLIFEK